jgi:hypothetical protein
VITLLIVEEWLTIRPQHAAQYSTTDDTPVDEQAGLHWAATQAGKAHGAAG